MATSLPPEGPAATPPAPPPKPGSHDASRMGTPSGFAPPPPPPPLPPVAGDCEKGAAGGLGDGHFAATNDALPQADIGPDPGDNWLPALLQDKSTQDLAALLSSPTLLNALTHAPQTAHPTLAASHVALSQVLAHNAQLAAQLTGLASGLSRQREATQARLLATHALERQWRQRQSDMDHALAPFSPASLYQRLAHGVQEQGAVCHAMEESFLDSEGEPASEREVADCVRRYREAKVQLYLRQERKERWDEGRVGGWR